MPHCGSVLDWARDSFRLYVSRDTHLLPQGSSTEEKAAVFKKFSDEARSAFKKYQVVYLKGIKIPQKYEDLLKSDKDSNYDDVNWKSEKPLSNNFSLARYPLTADEKSDRAQDIRTCSMEAAIGWK